MPPEWPLMRSGGGWCSSDITEGVWAAGVRQLWRREGEVEEREGGGGGGGREREEEVGERGSEGGGRKGGREGDNERKNGRRE